MCACVCVSWCERCGGCDTVRLGRALVGSLGAACLARSNAWTVWMVHGTLAGGNDTASHAANDRTLNLQTEETKFGGWIGGVASRFWS